MAKPQINWNDPHLWQHLGIIIDEFEKAALRSETRDGFLVTAHGPLEAMDQVLEGSEKALTHEQWGSTSAVTTSDWTSADERSTRTNYRATASATNLEDSKNDAQATAFTSVGMDRPEGGIPSPSVKVGFDISADADLSTIFPDGSVADKVADAIKECAGCDMRLHFKWQLQPIDLLGPIRRLLDDINAVLTPFEFNMDPFNHMQNFCDMANEFKMFCTPDLIMMLLSIKLLLRKYLSFAFEIKFDWSVILGPLLKLITELIGTMVSAIVNVMVAPIDCAVAVVESIAQLQRELNGIMAAAAAAGQAGVAAADIQSAGVDANGTVVKGNTAQTTTSWGATTSRAGASVNGTVQMKLPIGSPKKAATGVQSKVRMELPKAMLQKEFLSSHWSEKVLASLADARQWVTDLDKKLQIALNNLNALVGGGLALQLNNIGTLLFIKDMIGMVTTIIAMIESLASNVGGAKNIDFCELVQNQPELLRPHIERVAGRAAYGVTLVPEADRTENARLALYKGPELVGAIPTCVNKRAGTPEGELLAQWIADLNGNRT